ncbi:hypothetical protein H7X46_12675 [Pseudonocardia sp. C8]|uniref:hypothetical protein n=1 Tax=Pseudonocardia sp. C8 TaxID=2762759 RepID=UPI001642E966|nr:hypothetical protein [Pseudonocardia sp. C8]MBC3191918.1 hypothetical protein [Pseudonocardia sp. C8]
MTTATHPRPTRTPRRLGVRTRRAVLVTHIASAGAWLGVDVAMAVLIVTAMTTDEPATLIFSLQTLELVSIWPLLACGLLCLLSGVALGLGSKWGLVRYWWVAVKLVLNVVLTGLVLVALRSEVTTQAELARRLAAGEAVTFDLGNLVFPPTVSPTLLLVAITLSVVKPWGRIRRGAGSGSGATRSG